MRTQLLYKGLGVALGLLSVTQFASAASWPASSATTLYSSSSVEPSGIVWHSRLERLLVVGDEGELMKMKTDGSVETTWSVGGDLEGVTVADPASNYVYLAVERPNDSIVEFDLSTGQVTGKSWDVSSVMVSTDSNLGMEALAFVPNGKHPYTSSNSGGVFYAGLQADGKLYVFDLNLSSSGQYTHVGTVSTTHSSISDAYYSGYTNTLYTLSGATLREMRPNGDYIAEYTVPGTRQEGVTLRISACPATSATMYIAEDTPGAVKSYSNYPVNTTPSETTFYADVDGDGLGSDTTTTACTSVAPTGYVTNSNDLNDTDYDNDGVSTANDCNDADATQTTGSIFYQDADGDGLGSDSTTQVCGVVAPTGYVSNSNDLNDSDYDNDTVSSNVDCNDQDSSIFTLQTYYQDSDGDGLGSDMTSSICSYSTPSGYVTNSNDLNDADFDNDGVSTANDCNDADATQSTGSVYYQDADGDGLGSDVSTQVCGLTAPVGYVMNSNDVNDSDYDNDGVSISADCNDQDSSISSLQTYYEDKDGDGMGSSVTTSVCSTTIPTGYVTNSNESSDANDLIPNAGIEIAGDFKDNDGDGQVDEYNYVSSNGYHPYFSTLDPSNSTLANSSILSYSGAINGYIKIKYADNSIYRYSIFSITTNRTTKIRQVSSTAYFVITAPSGTKVKVNGYTGSRVSASFRR